MRGDSSYIIDHVDISQILMAGNMSHGCVGPVLRGVVIGKKQLNGARGCLFITKESNRFML